MRKPLSCRCIVIYFFLDLRLSGSRIIELIKFQPYMKVSIITSCYNREATIRDAVRSVLEQDYPEIEYIVVDGSSNDRSLEIIKSEEARTKSREFAAAHPKFTMTVVSEPDRGMYEAINKGIRMATGDVIGLVHSDDFLYDRHTVSSIVVEMQRTGCDFLYADGLFVDADNTGKVVRDWIGGAYSAWKVRHGWLPLHPTCYIRREVMLRLGLYNETFRIAADTDLLVRYLLGGHLTVHYYHGYVIRMRMGGMSTSSAKRKVMWHEDLRVYRTHGFNWLTLTKVEKILWKLPQFMKARISARK